MSREPLENVVFLCHRGGDVPDPTVDKLKHLFDKRFGTGATFVDHDLPKGAHAPRTIDGRLEQCRIFVAVIGKNWRCGPTGEKNIDDPQDWVHQEIRWALDRDRSRVEIMPILIDVDKMPEVCEELKDFGNHFATVIRSEHLESTELAALFNKLDQLSNWMKPRPFALVSSTLSYFGTRGSRDSPEGLDYFIALVTALVNQLQNKHREAVLKVPEFRQNDEATTVANQKRLVEEVLDNHKLYRGLIVAPYQVEPLVRVIMGYLNELDHFPIAFIDKGFAEESSQSTIRGLGSILSVENDGFQNGGIAAECLGRYLKQAGIQRANALIMLGRAGSAPRATGFEKSLAEQGERNGVDIVCRRSPPMDFTEEAGRKACLYYFDNPNAVPELFGRDCPCQVQAFFCCNDEMALGVRGALQQKAAAVKCLPHPIAIIGFDGIRDMTRILDRKGEGADPHMLNTIDVKVPEQVDRLIQMLMDYLAEKPLACRFEVQLGRAYLNAQEQYYRAAHIIGEHRRHKKRGFLSHLWKT
jgi:DNA-binding LacI/PurR family transcriptional regulator